MGRERPPVPGFGWGRTGDPVPLRGFGSGVRARLAGCDRLVHEQGTAAGRKTPGSSPANDRQQPCSLPACSASASVSSRGPFGNTLRPAARGVKPGVRLRAATLALGPWCDHISWPSATPLWGGKTGCAGCSRSNAPKTWHPQDLAPTKPGTPQALSPVLSTSPKYLSDVTLPAPGCAHGDVSKPESLSPHSHPSGTGPADPRPPRALLRFVGGGGVPRRVLQPLRLPAPLR